MELTPSLKRSLSKRIKATWYGGYPEAHRDATKAYGKGNFDIKLTYKGYRVKQVKKRRRRWRR